MIKTLSILAGYDKSHQPERLKQIDIHQGEILTILGDTGAGKSQLIEDIETLNQGEGLSQRTIYMNGAPPTEALYSIKRSALVAHLCQNMRFVLDLSVSDFLKMRTNQNAQPEQSAQNDQPSVEDSTILWHANTITGEGISPTQLLTRLSGGQSRALMMADVAFNSSAPIILIDELENAGINKTNALQLLKTQGKTILLVTHDPLIALMGEKRLIMKNGGMEKLVYRANSEIQFSNTLADIYSRFDDLRQTLREGEHIQGGHFHVPTSLLE